MSEHSPGTGQVTILSELDQKFLKSVGGALDDAAGTGAVSDVKTAMTMLKQLVNAGLAQGLMDQAMSDGTVNTATTIMGYLKHMMWMTHHAKLVFPAATNLTVTLTAHASADTWSAWTEIVDSGATTFSSIFAAAAGHVTDLVIEETNQASTRYMVEVAYGTGKTQVGAWRFISETNQVSVAQVTQSNGDMVPAGETLYYRCMCETAGKTALAYFKYFLVA